MNTDSAFFDQTLAEGRDQARQWREAGDQRGNRLDAELDEIERGVRATMEREPAGR